MGQGLFAALFLGLFFYRRFCKGFYFMGLYFMGLLSKPTGALPAANCAVYGVIVCIRNLGCISRDRIAGKNPTKLIAAATPADTNTGRRSHRPPPRFLGRE